MSSQKKHLQEVDIECLMNGLVVKYGDSRYEIELHGDDWKAIFDRILDAMMSRRVNERSVKEYNNSVLAGYERQLSK